MKAPVHVCLFCGRSFKCRRIIGGGGLPFWALPWHLPKLRWPVKCEGSAHVVAEVSRES